MFVRPQPLPVGQARRDLSDSHFLECARPAIISAIARDPPAHARADSKLGGGAMRALLEQEPPPSRFAPPPHPFAPPPPPFALEHPPPPRRAAAGAAPLGSGRRHHPANNACSAAPPPARPFRFAGKSSEASVDLGGLTPAPDYTGPDGTPRRRGPYAGRRGVSQLNTGMLFGQPPQATPGTYVDWSGNLKNLDPNVAKRANEGSKLRSDYLNQDADKHAAILQAEFAHTRAAKAARGYFGGRVESQRVKDDYLTQNAEKHAAIAQEEHAHLRAVRAARHDARVESQRVKDDYLTQNAEKHAAIAQEEHAHLRAVKAARNDAVLRAPIVEEIVFHHPLDAASAQAYPPVDREGVAGGRSRISGARGEFTEAKHVMYPYSQQPPQQGRRCTAAPAADKSIWADERESKPPPAREPTATEEAMYGGGYYSPSKSGSSPGGDGYALHGLPRRHPGAHRLHYGRAEDGQAYDRHGRKLPHNSCADCVRGP